MKPIQLLTIVALLINTFHAVGQVRTSDYFIAEDAENIVKTTPSFSLIFDAHSMYIENGQGKLIIRTVAGQIIKQITISKNEKTKIDTQDLSSGKYLLHLVQSDGSVQTQKFIK